LYSVLKQVTPSVMYRVQELNAGRNPAVRGRRRRNQKEHSMKSSAWVIGGLALAATLWAGDLWKDKKPADWQEKDVQKFLTKSPWAKTVPMQMDPSRMSGGGRGNRGGGGGYGGGGMGGGGGYGGGGGMGGGGMGGGGRGMGGGGGYGGGGGLEGAGGGGMPELPAAVVRWESAPLVREANARFESKEFNEAVAGFSKDYYVISVTTVGPERQGGWQGGSGQQEDPQQAADRRTQMQARVLAATSLKRGGSDSRAPERVETLKDSNGRVMLFLFPRALALENGEKDLNFETALGPAIIKARFNLKDMAQGSIQGL
jgi:hypothetical protein